MNSNPYVAATESTGEQVNQNATSYVAAAWQFHLFCILLLAASLFSFEDGRTFVALAIGRPWHFLLSVVSQKSSWEIRGEDLFAAAYRMSLFITVCCHVQAYFTGFTSKLMMLPSSILLTACHGFVGVLNLITLDLFCWFIFLYCVLSVAVAFGLKRQNELDTEICEVILDKSP